MKIYQEIATHEDLRDTLGVEHALMFFGGPVPSTVEELPFAVDLPFSQKTALALATTVIDHTYGNALHTVSKFDHDRTVAHPGVFIVDDIVPDHFNMVSTYVVNDNEITPKALTDEQRQVQIRIGNGSATGQYVEYRLKEAAVLTKLTWKAFTQSSSYAPAADFQVHDGNGWVTLHSFARYDLHSETGTVFDFVNTISSDRYRLVATGVASSHTYLPRLDVYTAVEPSTSITETITWAAMLPVNAADTAEENPVLWAEVGGPNDGKDIAIQSINPVADQGVVVMNFKLLVNTLGDIK